jgi:hypothetical protein
MQSSENCVSTFTCTCTSWIIELIDVTFHIEAVLKDIRWMYDNFGLWWSGVTPNINEFISYYIHFVVSKTAFCI